MQALESDYLGGILAMVETPEVIRWAAAVWLDVLLGLAPGQGVNFNLSCSGAPPGVNALGQNLEGSLLLVQSPHEL